MSQTRTIGGRWGWPAAWVGLAVLWAWVAVQGGLQPGPEAAEVVGGLLRIGSEVVPAMGLWWVAAYGWGRLLGQRGLTAAAAGMAGQLVLLYVLALVAGYAAGWLWGTLALGVAGAVWSLLQHHRVGRPSAVTDRGAAATHLQSQSFPGGGWGWLVAAPGLAMLAVAVCCPPGTLWRVEALGYDALSYHLQLPREWVAAGAMVQLPHNVYGYLPGLMESAYGWLMVMRQSLGLAEANPASVVGGAGGAGGVGVVYWCQGLHASLAGLAAGGVAGVLKPRIGHASAWSAAAAGGIVLLVPWVLVTGSLAYNELAVLGFASVAWAVLLAGSHDRSADDATANTPHPAPDADAIGPEMMEGGRGVAEWGARGRWRLGVVVGLLIGAATLAKLTAGFTVALPTAALWAWWTWQANKLRHASATSPAEVGRDAPPPPPPPPGSLPHPARRRRQSLSWRGGAVMVLTAAAVLLPYLARNASWTGNPVFPFATSVFGAGHWAEVDDGPDAVKSETSALESQTPGGHAAATRVARWEAAHRSSAGWGERWQAVWRQALGNRGYGAYGGRPTPAETQNIARFSTEGGLPVLWLAGLAGLGYGLTRPRWRGPAAAGVVVLAAQGLWWLTMTHLQSRFLVVGVLPLAWGVGLLLIGVAGPGHGESETGVGGPRHRAAVFLAIGLSAVLAVVSLTTLWEQTTRVTLPDGRQVPAPLWLVLDGLPAPAGRGVMASPAVNDLPPGSRVMVVGDNQSLFYARPELVYASAFDRSPITSILRDTREPAAVARRLRDAGVTHLWLGYSELDRLHATYGFDAGVTRAALQRITRGWQTLTPPGGGSVLLAVPNPE